MKTTITLTLKKETKGALQYANPAAETDPLFVLDTLYVRKAGIASATGSNVWPQSMTITLETPDSATAKKSRAA